MSFQTTTIKNNVSNSFEDLVIWQKAMDLAIRVYKLVEETGHLRKDLGLKGQIRSTVLSISDNIAAGFESQNKTDFYSFLKLAKSSCGKLRNKVLFIRNMAFIQNDIAQILLDDIDLLGKHISSLMKKLEQQTT